MKAFPNPMTLDRSGKTVENQVGMDLRDYFAAKAMQAMIGQCTNGNFDDFVIAEQAYQMADFMIEERNSNEQSN